jgi:hypothetical protein
MPTGISPKPVDFYADPARRPYGFRLINGSDLARPNAGGNVFYGLTFISDNPAYIQGDFNCHKNSGGNCNKPIEEFRDQTLSDLDKWGPPEFYDQRKRTQYGKFANPSGDSWRVSEVLVDALTILSDNFCDGSQEDGIVTVSSNPVPTNLPDILKELKRSTSASLQRIYGCRNSSERNTSYLNQNRPNVPPDPTLPAFQNWQRENPSDLTSPIRISPYGNPILANGNNYSGKYFGFLEGSAGSGKTRKKGQNKASEQRVNAVIISGIVPSRSLQSYGGLHNFPRMIEDWKNISQTVTGSLIQLNFSTYGTGPWEHEAWEAGKPALGGEDEYTCGITAIKSGSCFHTFDFLKQVSQRILPRTSP